MFKKISALCLATIISVFALAPALASADSLLTNEATIPTSTTMNGFVGWGFLKRGFSSATNTDAIDVWNLANPDSPSIIASVPTHGWFPEGLYVKGNYLYVAEQGQEEVINGVGTPVQDYLQIFKISNSLTTPLTSVGYIQSQGGQPDNVYVKGDYAYLLDWANPNSEIEVIDISNPASPTRVSVIPVSSPANMAFKGHYAYITSFSNGSLYTYDVQNPAAPVQENDLLLDGADGITINNGYAYITGSGESNISVVSIDGKPSKQSLVGTIATYANSDTYNVYVDGSTLFVTTINYYNHQILAFDLSSSETQPNLVQSYSTPGSNVAETLYAPFGASLLYSLENNSSGGGQLEVFNVNIQ